LGLLCIFVKQEEITLTQLAAALDADEFVYYYQPKVSLLTGKLCGAEALIRWQKPDGTLIPPMRFIPLAETTRFINRITLAMFEKLVIDMNIINDLDDSLVISFNASAIDFENDELTRNITQAITSQRITAKNLEVELTETSVLGEDEVIKRRLSALSASGVALVMDDYGTGFSSIDTLGKWPFSVIKIDQAIVQRMQATEKDRAIVDSSIHMAHKMELDVVAEGIETAEVYQALQNAGCNIAQGYWISRPLPLSGFLDFIKTRKRWPAVPIGLLHLVQLDHLQWRKAIIDGVLYLGDRKHRDRRDSLRGIPEMDPALCRLGRWFYSTGKSFANKDWYDRLEIIHRQLHQTGRELIEAARDGRPDTEITHLMRTLTEQSTQVLGLLQSIENDIIEVVREVEVEPAHAKLVEM